MAATRLRPRSRPFIIEDPNNSRYNPRLSKEQWDGVRPLIVELVDRRETIAAILKALQSRNIIVTRSQLGTQLTKWGIQRSRYEAVHPPRSGLDAMMELLAEENEFDGDDGDDIDGDEDSDDDDCEHGPSENDSTELAPLFLADDEEDDDAERELPGPNNSAHTRRPLINEVLGHMGRWHGTSSPTSEERYSQPASPHTLLFDSHVDGLVEKRVGDHELLEELEKLKHALNERARASDRPDARPSKASPELERSASQTTMETAEGALEERQSPNPDSDPNGERLPDHVVGTSDQLQPFPFAFLRPMNATMIGLTLAPSCTSSISSGFRSFKALSGKAGGTAVAPPMSVWSLTSGRRTHSLHSFGGITTDSMPPSQHRAAGDAVMGEVPMDWNQVEEEMESYLPRKAFNDFSP